MTKRPSKPTVAETSAKGRRSASQASAANETAAVPEPRFVTAFSDYLRSECHLADNTVAAYRRDLRRFYEWLGTKKIPSLTVNQLADYAGWLHDKNLAPASLARHIVSLKLFFRYLQLEGVLSENLVELLGSQKLWQRVPEVLPPRVIDELFETPKPGDPCWRRDRAMLEMLYATGCHASELSGMQLRVRAVIPPAFLSLTSAPDSRIFRMSSREPRRTASTRGSIWAVADAADSRIRMHEQHSFRKRILAHLRKP